MRSQTEEFTCHRKSHVDVFGAPCIGDVQHPPTGNFVLKQTRLNGRTLRVLDTVHVFPLCSTASMALTRASKGRDSCFFYSEKRLRMRYSTFGTKIDEIGVLLKFIYVEGIGPSTELVDAGFF